MLEIYSKQTWVHGKTYLAVVLQKSRIFPPGFWICLVVFILIGSRIIWIHESRPKHLPEIADAFGAINLFYDQAQLSHDGSQFTYVATSAHGYGLFLYDTASGRKQIILEENGQGTLRDERYLRALPWSPDNKDFIYDSAEGLAVYSLENKQSTSLGIAANAVSDIAWVNSSKFAYTIGDSNLWCAEKQPGGQWNLTRLTHSIEGKPASLTAIDSHTIAWLQDGFICRLDFDKNLKGTNDPCNFLLESPQSNARPPTNGLDLWLDTSTLQQPDQAPVAILPDLSSQRNDAVPMDNAPIYNAPGSARGLNGKATIHFASNGAFAKATGLKTKFRIGLTGPEPRTVFAVMHRDAGRQMLVNLGDTATQGAYFGLCAYYYGLCLPDAWGASSVINKSSVDWDILEVTYNGTNENGYVNGVFDSSINYPVNTVDKEIEIGKRSPNPTGDNATASDGDFAELLIYNRVLDDAERQQVEDYLSAKWFKKKLFTAENPLVWCDPKLTDLTGFDYSGRTGEFLLNRNEENHESLWSFTPEKTDKVGKLALIAREGSIQEAQWTGAKDCAYIGQNFGHQTLVMVDSSGAKKSTLFEHGNVDWIEAMPQGNQLLVQCTVSNELSSGIWQYDIKGDQFQPLVSYSDYPSKYAKNVDPQYGFIALPSGEKLNYLLYFPANFDPHKKYPLVIGGTPFWAVSRLPHGRPWLPPIATCGAFVATVDRADWFNGIEKWGDNVLTVYENLIKNPCIDPHRVYLFSSSAETTYMGRFMAQSPGLWRGGILLNPTELPDFSQSPPLQPKPKMLVIAGGEEQEQGRLNEYQKEALKSGVITEVVLAPDEGHRFVGKAAHIQRLQEMERFIFEQ
jgi:hypothetical protein